ncbi:Uncharacterised protein [uncultured archaeon]|nr:Uncharacterised protein [uncultured archaeon]
MKIQVKANELAKKLQRALGVIPAKPTIPVLAYVKLETTSATTATLSALDLGMAIIQTISVALVSTELGTILLPARVLSQLLAPLPSDAVVTIENQDKTIVVKSGKLLKEAKLPGMDVALFPAIDPRPATTANFNSAAFKKVIGRAEFAAPTKQGRSTVPSVLLESTAAYLRGVATDGARVAVADVKGAGAGELSIQLPKSFLAVLKEITGEVIQFSQSENNLFFATESETMFVRVPTTKFPPYQKVLAFADYVSEFDIAVPSFKTSLDIIAVTADSKAPAVVVTATAEELNLASSSAADGMTDSAVDIKLQGPANKARVNLSFVNEFLGQCEGSVKVQMSNPTSPVRITSGDDYQYFIMPMLEQAPATEEKKKSKG